MRATECTRRREPCFIRATRHAVGSMLATLRGLVWCCGSQTTQVVSYPLSPPSGGLGSCCTTLPRARALGYTCVAGPRLGRIFHKVSYAPGLQPFLRYAGLTFVVRHVNPRGARPHLAALAVLPPGESHPSMLYRNRLS
jgi:hypothetical protein